MLREVFSGRRPSHFIGSPIVRAFIIEESFLWSAWNFVIPLFPIFIVKNVQGGSIESAAMAYSIYLVARVICELLSGRFLKGSNDRTKLIVSIIGMVLLSVSYMGFAFSATIYSIVFFYVVMGIGLGIASPAKSALFSMHLDKNKETTEWGFLDAVTFICIALAVSLGGFIATAYGFPSLFLLASVVNILGIIPYLLLLL